MASWDGMDVTVFMHMFRLVSSRYMSLTERKTNIEEITDKLPHHPLHKERESDFLWKEGCSF